MELPCANARIRMNVWLALHFPNLSHRPGISPVLGQAAAEFEEYFRGEREAFSVALDPVGTEFQLAVWNEVARIPYRRTKSYGEIARLIGRDRAVRAVGAANAVNPLPIIVPCHRVIGSDGSLTGYAGGLSAKRWLLDHEGVLAGSARASRPEQPSA